MRVGPVKASAPSHRGTIPPQGGAVIPGPPDPGRILQELASRAPDVIYRYRFHPDRRLEFVNPAIEPTTGYPPPEFYADRDLWFSIVHPDDRQALLRTLRQPTTPAPVRVRWQRRDGTLVSISQRNTPFHGSDGTLLGFDGIARADLDPPAATTRCVGDIEIDFLYRRVRIGRQTVGLTRAEFVLLGVLSERPDEIVPRDELVKRMWDSEHVGDARACEVHISNLRKKLEPDPLFPQRIVTIRRMGYMLRTLGAFRSP